MARALAGALALGSPATVVAHPGYDAQLQSLDARVRAAPRDIELRLRRAELYRRAGHLHDALADLAVVARRIPDDPRMRLERALVRIAQGRTRTAERELDALLADGHGSVPAYRERARIREAAGRHAQARTDYDAAIAIAATPDLVLDRARMDEALGDLEAAAQGLADGRATLHDPVVLCLRAADVERRRDRPDLALPIVDALLERTPRHVEWVLLRADVLAELARPEEALGERLRALVLSVAAVATRPTALHVLARAKVYLALDRPAAALADLQTVVTDAPELNEARELLRATKETLG